jgi:hypothetical protein
MRQIGSFHRVHRFTPNRKYDITEIVVSMFYPITGNNDTLTAADGVVVTGAEVGTENDICSKNIKDKVNSV